MGKGDGIHRATRAITKGVLHQMPTSCACAMRWMPTVLWMRYEHWAQGPRVSLKRRVLCLLDSTCGSDGESLQGAGTPDPPTLQRIMCDDLREHEQCSSC